MKPGISQHAGLPISRIKLGYLAGAAFILFMHWGFSEFLSVQFIFYLLVAVVIGPRLLTRTNCLIFALSAAIAYIGMSLAAGDDTHMVLKGLRTASVMALLYAARYRFSRGTPKEAAERYEAVAAAMTFACVVSIIVAGGQLIDSLGPNSGIFDVPAKYFALNYGTLFHDKRAALANVGFFIRPSGLFSEPSSLALLGNFGLLVGLVGRRRRLVMLGLLIVGVSYSLSGFLTCIFILAYFFFNIDRGSRSIFTNRELLLLFVVSASIGIVLLGSRMENIGHSADASSVIRVYEPLRILAGMVDRGNYFGLPPDILLARMNVSVITIFDNWVLNQFLYYGIFGFIPLLLVLYCFGFRLGVIVLMFGTTNGDLFYYDRLVFLIFMVAAVTYSKRAAGVPGQ